MLLFKDCYLPSVIAYGQKITDLEEFRLYKQSWKKLLAQPDTLCYFSHEMNEMFTANDSISPYK